MTYQIVTFDEELGWATKDAADIDALVAWCEVRGYAFSHNNTNSRQRAELQGEPVFSGLNGPMWNGGVIRYECTNAYSRLSA